MTAATRKKFDNDLPIRDRRPEARYYYEPSLGLSRIWVALFDLVDAEIQHAQRIAEAVDTGVDVKELRKEEAATARLNRLLLSANLGITVEADGIQAVNARRGAGPPFDVAALSDGQRAALLLAATVLTAEGGKVLLIDEPERHLHRAISAPLLRDLFAERPDCALVVSTHEIDLAAAHCEARVLLTREYWPVFEPGGSHSSYSRKVEAWDLDWLEPGADFPEDLRRDVLGGRRRILFHRRHRD